MNAVGALSVADFDAALAEARAVGRTGARLPSLAAPVDAALAGRVDEAWDAIEGALRAAWRGGKDASRAVLDAAIERVDGLVQSAGARASAVTDALLERLRTMMRAIIDRALANVRPQVDIGEVALTVKQIAVTQTVLISGSLSANITEMWSLTSNGELTVAATYERAE